MVFKHSAAFDTAFDHGPAIWPDFDPALPGAPLRQNVLVLFAENADGVADGFFQFLLCSCDLGRQQSIRHVASLSMPFMQLKVAALIRRLQLLFDSPAALVF
jgi:hypothetical protein